ncbi:(S)-phenoxypropionate/alpha-ketoglutarate-dioxygenase [Labeo rohita]|uniref:(S)-phenoxypropionate/alpha-ketoglutarate-dioxygenase n=1 Tax=Labeo rohita TaxID=84645 RepID=A0ABQ8MJZ3_LABRO|nr:(S)-phenoxypropionate/alpha-ketoglutarate-dioxygenase [Labeo rohita]
MFDSFGGIDFLLSCDFEPSKLKCKLSSFHSQVLLYWKLIYKHNFSPHSCSLWNNKCILIKGKSVYFQDWMDKGVWSIVHIMDGCGNFLSYDDFCVKYNIICTQKLYASLLKAGPAGLVQLIKGALCYCSEIPRLGNLIISGVNLTEQSCKNKVLRTLLNTQTFPSKVKKRR